MIAFAVAAVAGAIATPDPSLRPNPIGVGPLYRPRAAEPHVLRGLQIDRFRCEGGGSRFGIHLELFARRRVVIVPAGIGVSARCSYAARTTTPTGIVEVSAGSRLVLRDLFRLWGQPFGRRRLVGFRSALPLLAFVDGRRWRGDPGAIPLRRHAQIVLELDGYVPPHSSFLFPGGL
jgi:hypothetical protein